MADEAQTIRLINWREVFPFTHLFRAFRIAVHPSKLLLALAALLAIYFGGRLLDAAWIDRYKPVTIAEVDAYFIEVRTPEGRALQPVVSSGYERPGIFITFFEYQLHQIDRVVRGGIVGGDWYGGFDAIWRFIAVGPGWLFGRHPVFAIIFTAWFLLIWSLFGGAISRIAAVHVARDEKISVRQALRFSISKILSFLFAPLIPLLIILFIGVVVAATGWVLLHIPYVGPIVMGLVFFLALLAGFIMTLVALGTIGGFNLMFPTVAVEGSDSFDAISRSFSYVFARPWRMLFYTLVALVYGAIAYLFVRFFVFVMLSLTHFFVGWWLGGEPALYWKGANAMWPQPTWLSLPYEVPYDSLKWSEDFAAGMISLWVYLAIGLLGAFAISFYFSANTIIYYLMRREVDATELDDVYVEETEDEFGEPVTTTPVAAAAPASTPTEVSPATSVEPATTTAADDAGGARAYPIEGGSGTLPGNSGDTGNTNQAPGGGTSNP